MSKLLDKDQTIALTPLPRSPVPLVYSLVLWIDSSVYGDHDGLYNFEKKNRDPVRANEKGESVSVLVPVDLDLCTHCPYAVPRKSE